MKITYRLAGAFLLCAACILSLQARAQSIEYVSGNGQAAVVGSLYAQPWVVRVAAFEVVRFGSFYSGAVTFDGADLAYVTADQNGLATSPTPRANLPVGQGLGYALGEGGSGWIFFDYVNLSPSLTAVVDWPWNGSVGIGYQTVLPFKGRVLDATGAPAQGVRFTFTTDPACGAFDGSATYDGVTGDDGTATSPPFTGVGQNLSCPRSLAFEGADPASLSRPIVVYPREGVGIMLYPPSVDAVSGQIFQLKVSFAFSGIPIGVPPGVGITIGVDHNGATATRWGESITEIESNTFFAGFLPNDANGDYNIVFSLTSTNTATVPVRQRKKAK